MPKLCVGTGASDPADGNMNRVEIQRRDCGADDVFVRIQYCGLCHSDVHTVHGDWGWTGSHVVIPGHEAVGVVEEVGSAVTTLQVGQRVGIGCFVDSCNDCEACANGDENYCERGVTQTYNTPSRTEGDPCPITQGGLSNCMTVKAKFAFPLPDSIPMEVAGPLLCAGITMFAPLKRAGMLAGGKHVAVVGFGGLGHMGVKLALAMGNRVTVLSRGDRRKAAIEALGATHLDSTNPFAVEYLEAHATFDTILDTVAASHPITPMLPLLKHSSTLFMIGGVPEPFSVGAFDLLPRRLALSGSLVGGTVDTNEMLQFCAAHGILPDVQVIPPTRVNEAVRALSTNSAEVSRYVVDMATMVPGDWETIQVPKQKADA